jgi:hypothetical protein
MTSSQPLLAVLQFQTPHGLARTFETDLTQEKAKLTKTIAILNNWINTQVYVELLVLATFYDQMLIFYDTNKQTVEQLTPKR